MQIENNPRWLWAALMALLLLIAPACRVNHLPEYLPRVENTHMVRVIPPGPVINFGVSQQDNLAAAIITQIVTAEAEQDIGARLEAAASPEELSDTLGAVMTQELDKSFGLAVVPSHKDPHDTRLELTIVDYGLTAASPESEVFYFFQVEARMIYIPENKLIWELDDTLSYPLKDFHIYSNSGAIQAFSAASNLSALDDLSPEQLREIFLDFAAAAGRALMAQMREDATNN
jgi:hypothetical protein